MESIISLDMPGGVALAPDDGGILSGLISGIEGGLTPISRGAKYDPVS